MALGIARATQTEDVWDSSYDITRTLYFEKDNEPLPLTGQTFTMYIYEHEGQTPPMSTIVGTVLSAGTVQFLIPRTLSATFPKTNIFFEMETLDDADILERLVFGTSLCRPSYGTP